MQQFTRDLYLSAPHAHLKGGSQLIIHLTEKKYYLDFHGSHIQMMGLASTPPSELKLH